MAKILSVQRIKERLSSIDHNPILRSKYKNTNKYELDFEGINVLFDTTDFHSKRWFFPRYVGTAHEPATTKLFIDTIKENDCIIDIGGHLGYFTCVSAVLAKNGQVHTFEVDPNCVPLIEKNKKINDFQNVFINNFAVADKVKKVRIPSLNHPHSGMRINSEQNNFIEIDAITLDDYVYKNNLKPNFIKIDVEGAEYQVLQGMKETLKQPQLKLLVEVHVDLLSKHFDTDYRVILNLLDEYGFNMKELIEHRKTSTPFIKINKNSDLKGNTMIICEKS